MSCEDTRVSRLLGKTVYKIKFHLSEDIFKPDYWTISEVIFANTLSEDLGVTIFETVTDAKDFIKRVFRTENIVLEVNEKV